MKKSGIYCIKNTTTGKMYIGFSADVEGRRKKHYSDLIKGRHVNKHLQSSWNEYGENAFCFYIIEECDKDILEDREIYYIKKLNTTSPNGYNLTGGGEGNKNPTPETRIKMGNGNRGRKLSDEWKANMSISKIGNSNNLGKHHSAETKERISAKLKGRQKSEQMRKKLSETNKLNPSKGMQGKTHSEKSKEKMSLAKKGKSLSEEHKKKISETRKLRYSKQKEE